MHLFRHVHAHTDIRSTNTQTHTQIDSLSDTPIAQTNAG